LSWRFVIKAAVTIPVGIAIIAYPRIIMMLAQNWPNPVDGDRSPYPTVVRVTIAQ
jgi:hypothetical protein